VSPVKVSPVAAPVAALAIYECLAAGVNFAMSEPVLPTFTSSINRFTWRGFGRRLNPPWAPTVTFAAIGFAAGLARSTLRPRSR
jgi:hypothetical protein